MKHISIGEIVDGSGAEFCRELADAPPGPVVVRINSVGGIVDEAWSMYRAIEERGDVTAYVTGLAASAATIPMCAADKVRIADGAQVMIHLPTSEARGNAAELRATADSVERTERDLSRMYSAKTGLPTEKVLRMLQSTTYLDATEAKRLGFAEEIVPMRSRDLANVDIGQLPNPPRSFARAVAQARSDAASRTTAAAVDSQITQALGLEDDTPLETVLATIMAMRQAAPEAPAAPEPEAAADDDMPETEAAGDGDPDMVAAVAEMPPEQQAKVLAVHARTEARIRALESEAHAAVLARVPQNLRAWAKKQTLAVVRDFVASLPAEQTRAARPPARTENAGPSDAEKAEREAAEAAVAKALGRPVDYVRRTPASRGAR